MMKTDHSTNPLLPHHGSQASSSEEASTTPTPRQQTDSHPCCQHAPPVIFTVREGIFRFSFARSNTSSRRKSRDLGTSSWALKGLPNCCTNHVANPQDGTVSKGSLDGCHGSLLFLSKERNDHVAAENSHVNPTSHVRPADCTTIEGEQSIGHASGGRRGEYLNGKGVADRVDQVLVTISSACIRRFPASQRTDRDSINGVPHSERGFSLNSRIAIHGKVDYILHKICTRKETDTGSRR